MSHRRRAANIHGVVLPERIEHDLTVTEDGTFAFGQTPGAPTVFSDACLMPGLVDAHAPLTIQSPAGDDAPAQDRARASLHANLDSGVLAVREMGAPDWASIALSHVDGLPRVLPAGRWLAAPGRFTDNWAIEVDSEALPEAALNGSR